MRIGGDHPWHWTYWTKFTGVELEFLSESGESVGSHSKRIRCLRTVDWARAWMVFETPPGTAQVRVSFVLDCPTHIEMYMDVDDVSLEELGDEPPAGLGRLAVGAAKGDGAQTFARFSVKDSGGGSHCPRYAYAFKSGIFYHLNDHNLNYLDLEPGRYKVRATKGPEFEAAEDEIEVRAGERTKVTLPLNHSFPEPKGEWLGGDHHVHLFFHKQSFHPQITVDDVMKIAKGEGLNFVSFCGEWTEFTANLGNFEIAADPDFVGQVGLESVNDFYGHTCTMGWKSVPEQSIPLRCVPWPMNTDTIETLTAQGGAWINAHPFDRIMAGSIVENMGDPDRLCNARELPVILALGHRTNFDILCHSTPGGAELKTMEYYRLLNMGFRIGITASTDFYVDQARGTPGHNRTYVRAGSLDFGSIAEAYREGRTYATNGPLIDFQVEATKIGDELRLPAGTHTIRAKVKAFSRMGLDRAKVIVNGTLHTALPATGGWIEGECDIQVEESSWVAVHLEGPVNDDVEPWDLSPDQRNLQSQFAHTSPVYVQVGDVPIKPSREDVEFLIDWIDASVKAFHALDRMWDGHPEESYLESSFSAEDRRRITAAFEERTTRAKDALRGMLSG
jgi:hypothetical protein